MSMDKIKWQVAIAVGLVATFMALAAKASEPNAIHVVENSIKMKLVYVPPGEFEMGSPVSEEDRRDNETLHHVKLTKGFYLGVYEVTQSEFERIMKRNPSRYYKAGEGADRVVGADTSSFAVDSVSWYDAMEFCNELSKSEGLPEYYTLQTVIRPNARITFARVTEAGGDGYRLPTEAEWEYACRAGTKTMYYYGDLVNGEVANVNGNSPYGKKTGGPVWGRTREVGSYKPNAFGLFDMHGNVTEWCNDWFDGETANTEDAIDPKGADSCGYRANRGGSFLSATKFARSACRGSSTPTNDFPTIGFRVARNIGLLSPPPVVQQPVQSAPDLGPSSPSGLSPAVATQKQWRSVGLIAAAIVMSLVLAAVGGIVGAYNWRTDESVDVYRERDESTFPSET